MWVRGVNIVQEAEITKTSEDMVSVSIHEHATYSRNF